MGSAATLLKNRSPGLAKLYRRLETTIKGFGDVEVVTRKRYALFRTARIFADLTVMQDALRLVIHLRPQGRPTVFYQNRAERQACLPRRTC